MRLIKIFYFLSGSMFFNEIKYKKEFWKVINKYLNDLKEGKEIIFDQLFIDLNIIEKNYLFVVFFCFNVLIIFL